MEIDDIILNNPPIGITFVFLLLFEFFNHFNVILNKPFISNFVLMIKFTMKGNLC